VVTLAVREVQGDGDLAREIDAQSIDPALTSVLPYRVLCVPGRMPVSEGERVVAGLGIAGPDAGICQDIADSVLATRT
jgi:uncharacterized protein GlcG (DUF336 family)